MLFNIVHQWNSFKFKRFEPDDKVFDFLKEAKVDCSDNIERVEALAFYHGYILGYKYK